MTADFKYKKGFGWKNLFAKSMMDKIYVSELQEGNLKYDTCERATKPQTYCHRTKWDLH